MSDQPDPRPVEPAGAPPRLGLAGRLAQQFQANALTPLLALVALVALLLGLFAVGVTPREEEPQINVTMANVLIPFPGASSANVQAMVARPAEAALGQIAGNEHTYSVSRPGLAVLTVQFKVGVPRTEALVRLYDVLDANQDWLPAGLGALTPIVKPKGIDDAPTCRPALRWKAPPPRCRIWPPTWPSSPRCWACKAMPAAPARSPSTAWCASTSCAPMRAKATCRSTWSTRPTVSRKAMPSPSACARRWK